MRRHVGALTLFLQDFVRPAGGSGGVGRRVATRASRELAPPSRRALRTCRAASLSSSVEFFHGSGSFSEVDATYFSALSSTSVYGLSVCVGQNEKKSS